MKKIQPAVVIGLGGTGVKTITYLKRALQEQSAEFMEVVRFLAIDIEKMLIKFGICRGNDNFKIFFGTVYFI